MTGFRLGAAIGPRRLIDIIVRLNVNWESCANHFAQYGALEALTGGGSGTTEMLARLRERRDAAVAILNATPGIDCLMPETTFYLYPNVTAAVRMSGCGDHEDFRRLVLERTGVSFCTRPHFGSPLPGESQFYLRLSYSGLTTEQIQEGLGKLREFAGSWD
jgi:aspartate/methionine/tyrosine aminotransferase